MIAKKIKLATASVILLASASTLVGLPSIAVASAPGNLFVTVTSHQNYVNTLSSLRKAVQNNGLMVMGKVNQKAILSMTGLNIEGGESFLVGNPRIGKKLFSMTPAVGAAIPARIYVWAKGGVTHISYYRPSVLFGAISEKLGMAGKMMDKKFRMIVKQSAQ